MCACVCIFCCYHLPSERQLYLVITHVAASLGTICSASGIGSCISTSMSELFEDSSRSLSLISITSSIRSSSTSKIQFLFAFVFTLFFALRQQLFLLSVCVLCICFCTPPKKSCFPSALRCVALGCCFLPSVRGFLEFKINEKLIKTVVYCTMH